ncbi:putative nuclease HARBI1 [Wyeomyia smithii]|uniref:putative nuclease HARBI1 n=1 Tax=Wyeomyia smithii TaxID=174621 RepID=UPI0024681956|nr:putative nuclease HARBI1 [Wyeomyia smithii]
MRSVWVRDWVKRRQDRGFYNQLLRELEDEVPLLYQNFLRMNIDDFHTLLELVSPLIKKQDSNMREVILAGERLALTLRFLATGDSFMSLQYLFRIPQSTISTIISEVCDAIHKALKPDFLKFPSTEENWLELADNFNNRWIFSHCIGAIDGNHIVMKAPVHSGSVYYNYKGTHSVVLMTIADAQYRFTYIDVCANGRISDGGVFNRTSFFTALTTDKLSLPTPKPLLGRDEPIPYFLVGDNAFALSNNLMKPYAQRNLNGLERIFNFRLSRARRVVENAFGLLASRFRVFEKPIQLNPEKVRKITIACCTLHNYLMMRSRIYFNPTMVDRCDGQGSVIEGDWRRITNIKNSFYPLEVRRTFVGNRGK